MEDHNAMVMDILKNHPTEFCNDIHNMVQEGRINGELDLKLRSLETIEPYNMVVPLFREILGLTITTDEECISELNSLKEYMVGQKNIDIINQIIDFINGKDLDEDIVPEVDLITMMEHIPVAKYPTVYNCVDYITEISDIS